MSKKKMTMGLIVGNSGCFHDHLANSGREEMIAVLQKAEMDVVVLSPQESKYEVLYSLYSKLYFVFGTPGSRPMSDVLPQLTQMAQPVTRRSTASKIGAGS